MKEAGIDRYPSVRVPLLNQRQRRARVEWARAHVDWTPKIGAESGRSLGTMSGKDMIWCRTDEKLVPVMNHVTYTPGAHLCWSLGLGPNKIVSHGTTMKAASYKEIMEQRMISDYRSLPGRVIFQHDGARYHTVKAGLSFLEEQVLGH